MQFFRIARRFHVSEDGAVTVDWVVLTAAVVGLGIAALAAVKSGMKTLTGSINDQLSSQSISTTFD